MSADLVLAKHVGICLSYSVNDDSSIIAFALAAGPRAECRALVLDTRDWSPVSAFAIPNQSGHGSTDILMVGSRLLAADEHKIVAFDARTGERMWERSFSPTKSIRLGEANGSLLLLTLADPDGECESRLIRVLDGSDDRTVPPGASVLSPDGTLFYVSTFEITKIHPDGGHCEIELSRDIGWDVGVVALDDVQARLVVGGRDGVFVADLTDGSRELVSELSDIESVGFHRGDPWALDAEGRLTILGPRPMSVDLGVTTGGGFLMNNATRAALWDHDRGVVCVRSLPANEELFVTNRGCSYEALCVDADGGLLVANGQKTIRIDPSTGKILKVGSSVRELRRLQDGALVLVGSSIRLLPPGLTKAQPVASGLDDCSFTRSHGVAWSDRRVVVWDRAVGERTFELDLDETWVGETNDVADLAYVGPDGRPWIHLSNGCVAHADAIPTAGLETDVDGGHVCEGNDCENHTVERDDGVIKDALGPGAFHLHPDGKSLLRVTPQAITRLALPGFEESAPLARAINSEVTRVEISPSGDKLLAFHHNGRLSVLDLLTNVAVAIDSPETSAAERAPNEICVVDALAPTRVAFGREEKHVAWTTAGGVTFADTTTGALVGRFFLASNGRDWAVTDGKSFDWSNPKKPISDEIVAVDGSAVLEHPELLRRRVPGLLATLTL